MRIIECDKNCYNIAKNILRETISWFHTYYALSCIEYNICKVIVAYNEDSVLGIGIFYTISRPGIGIIYYIVVPVEHRNRGIGKAIVASIEEILEYEYIDIFMATTKRNNIASRKIFMSLGYNEIELSSIDKEVGEILTMITCGYEDDFLYIKSRNLDTENLFNIFLYNNLIKLIENIWRKICYNPWKKLKKLYLSS